MRFCSNRWVQVVFLDSWGSVCFCDIISSHNTAISTAHVLRYHTWSGQALHIPEIRRLCTGSIDHADSKHRARALVIQTPCAAKPRRGFTAMPLSGFLNASPRTCHGLPVSSGPGGLLARWQCSLTRAPNCWKKWPPAGAELWPLALQARRACITVKASYMTYYIHSILHTIYITYIVCIYIYVVYTYIHIYVVCIYIYTYIQRARNLEHGPCEIMPFPSSGGWLDSFEAAFLT